MSKYTAEVRFICETASGLGESKGYTDVDTIITSAIPKIFTFTFPIFDENYRLVLEKKILKHFYTREICEETVGLWKLRLDTKLNEIMPYYNKLYNSELLEFNPLYTTDLTRTRKTDFDKSENDEEKIQDSTNSNSSKNNSNSVTNSGKDTITTSASGTTNRTDESVANGSGNGSSTNGSTNKYSDTPQGALTNVENGTYLTNATKIDESGTTTSSTHNESNNASTITSNDSGTNTTEFGKIVSGSEEETLSSENSYNRNRENKNGIISTEDYLEHVSGYEGVVPSDLLQKYRETFLNIDMMVINNLEDLFFQLW